MNAPSRLPHVPAPPHDPDSLLLAGWVGPEPARGFHVLRLDRVELDAEQRALRLAPAPDSARLLSEPSGGFGGHHLPDHLALDADGELYLVDRQSASLSQLDRCACRFVPLPRFVSARPGTTRTESRPAAVPLNVLSDPQGIAAHDGDLYIADRGHARVVRFAIAGWRQRDALAPPSQRPSIRWQPTGLAFDHDATLHVSDPFNGRIDRFDRHGQWQGAVEGLPGVTHLAVDGLGHLHATVLRGVEVTQTMPTAPTSGVARVLDSNVPDFSWHAIRLVGLPPAARVGIELATTNDGIDTLRFDDWYRVPSGAAQLSAELPLIGRFGRRLFVRVVGPDAERIGAITARGGYVVAIAEGRATRLQSDLARFATGFPPPALPVDASGNLRIDCASGPAVFDRRGRRLADEQLAIVPRYVRSGEYLSTALDSRIDACIWHRLELDGRVPPHCSVRVQVTTADLELGEGELADLPEHAWTTPIVAGAMAGRWDCLFRAPPGRYLWLRLTLTGDGHRTPTIDSLVIEFPRVSLRRHLPAVFGADPAGADFTDRFTAVFDATLRSIEGHVDRQAALFDPLATPADATPGGTDFLGWLAGWIGVSLSRDWSEVRRRHYLKQAARLYPARGTPEGLRQQLLLLLGFDHAYRQRCLAERPQRRCVPEPVNCAPRPAAQPATPPPLLLEHYRLRRWLYAGHGRLGDDSMLWGSRLVDRAQLAGGGQQSSGSAVVGRSALTATPDPLTDPFRLHAYRFSVFVPARVREQAGERRALEQLLAREAPAHTEAEVHYVEPRFRVGVQAMIGLDSVIARTPIGVRLDETELRRGSVLGGRRRGRGFAVGDARIGSGNRLG